MRKITICVVILLCVASVANAATYYVATTGNDANVGSSGSPWLTIQKAADTMAAGDTVNVAAGTYAARVFTTTSGTAGNPITYQTTGTVVMQGFYVQASYVTVHGFEITNTNSTFQTGTGVLVYGDHNRVENNYIHDLYWEGVWIWGDTSRVDPATNNNVVIDNVILRARVAGVLVEGTNNTVESNEISHTIQNPAGAPSRSSADADGIRFFGSGHVIKKNYIHDILESDSGQTDPHIDCFQTWGPASNIIFEQNKCHGANANLQAAQIGNSSGSVYNLTFRNNIFYNATRGINLAASSPGCTKMSNLQVYNNTFYNLDEQAVNLANAPGSKIQNNLFYNVGSDTDAYVGFRDVYSTGLTIGYNAHYSSAGVPAGSAYPNDIWDTNPVVVNAGTYDFHLQTSSPLKNTGATITSITVDYDSLARPKGSAYEIGAFEYNE